MSGEDCEEIQADTLEEVVKHCLAELRAKRTDDVIIDDSGLFIDALGGFPGVYSSYVYRTLGCRGILRLLSGSEDRKASFVCIVGCIAGGADIVVSGMVEGSIGFEERGDRGFGFDPIFIPKGYERTFAEMTVEEKNPISHRGRAIRALSSALGRRIEEGWNEP